MDARMVSVPASTRPARFRSKTVALMLVLVALVAQQQEAEQFPVPKPRGLLLTFMYQVAISMLSCLVNHCWTCQLPGYRGADGIIEE